MVADALIQASRQPWPRLIAGLAPDETALLLIRVKYAWWKNGL